MRITLHAVHAEGYPAFHNAMLSSLRASRLKDRRYTTSGPTYADADRLAPQLLEFADRPRTRAEVDDLLSVHDVAQFTLLRRPVVRDALVTLAADVEQLEGPDGSELFDEAWAGLAAEAGGWWRSWPTANPWSTAATPTGGTSCRAGWFGCSLGRAWR
jgi:hypothetical protein